MASLFVAVRLNSTSSVPPFSLPVPTIPSSETLPYWLLDRTMANTTTLATNTCFLFENGRFYGWEGVACCPGTCTHVWHYAQAPGRLFPEIERDTRVRVDFRIGFHDDGSIGHRADLNGRSMCAEHLLNSIRIWRHQHGFS